jgi:hypothetical protein
MEFSAFYKTWRFSTCWKEFVPHNTWLQFMTLHHNNQFKLSSHLCLNLTNTLDLSDFLIKTLYALPFTPMCSECHSPFIPHNVVHKIHRSILYSLFRPTAVCLENLNWLNYIILKGQCSQKSELSTNVYWNFSY